MTAAGGICGGGNGGSKQSGVKSVGGNGNIIVDGRRTAGAAKIVGGGDECCCVIMVCPKILDFDGSTIYRTHTFLSQQKKKGVSKAGQPTVVDSLLRRSVFLGVYRFLRLIERGLSFVV